MRKPEDVPLSSSEMNELNDSFDPQPSLTAREYAANYRLERDRDKFFTTILSQDSQPVRKLVISLYPVHFIQRSIGPIEKIPEYFNERTLL